MVLVVFTCLCTSGYEPDSTCVHLCEHCVCQVQGRTPLHCASLGGCEGAVRDFAKATKHAALRMAVLEHVVNALIAGGADVNRTDVSVRSCTLLVAFTC